MYRSLQASTGTLGGLEVLGNPYLELIAHGYHTYLLGCDAHNVLKNFCHKFK